MHNLIKKIAKKYIPNFLIPYAYQCYLCFSSVYYFVIEKRKFIKQSQDYLVIIEKLAKLPTVQILQPTFYDLDGKNYFSGGAERYLNDLAKIILSMGYTPYIIQGGNKFWHKKHRGLDVFGVPSSTNNVSLNKFAHHPLWGKPHLRIYSPFILAFPLCDENSIGISHGIFWDHSIYYKNFPFFHMCYKSLKSLKKFISVDTSTISWVRSSLQNLSSDINMSYIPNYVDLTHFSPIKKTNKDKIRITYPRRLQTARGYLLVCEIASDILTKYPNVELHFIGYIHESPKEIKLLIKKFPGRIVLYNELDSNMNKIYQDSDIVLIPTIASEGTSLSCLEAMATGNAVIATNVGGLPNLIIDNYNGLLINPNSQELKDAVEKLINNYTLRKQLGDNALKIAKCFDKKIWEAKWQEILKQALNLQD